MEFKLNKIDTEIRQMVNEATKPNKIHKNRESTKIDKDKREDERQKQQEFEKTLKKLKSKKKKFTVKAVMKKDIKVEASRESKGNLTQGRFLDTKR